MPETKIKSPILSGGISRQPAHLRLPSQVEDATNFLFSVADGATRRQGTRAYLSVSDLPAATDLRSHAIARDESEQYLMVYGNGVVRVFDLDGPEATVDITSGAADYLAEGNPGIDDLRVRTITDTTVRRCR
jgi:hypothetical protein